MFIDVFGYSVIPFVSVGVSFLTASYIYSLSRFSLRPVGFCSFLRVGVIYSPSVYCILTL